ncbi:rab guanine nucleotide exchange factor S2 [Mortierella polycephala]|uniref:Rab guanine nucleotide exchange factor S2 n=1 Tax=Mortierella polycephala TaxID=41804 RepID=A0A9P6Q6I7_9FUNG|nr:rab guanine nucleotide exchange factor S2 [Mortierella polycephala]
MSVACTNCGAAVQLISSLDQQQLQMPDDPLIPFVKAQIDNLTAQNSNLVAENDSLSSKLVESTDGRMDLDQQLNITQMDLQAAQNEIKTLKESQKHYEQLLNMISSGQLIEKKDVQPVIENLAYEAQRRSQVENSKMKLESELEDLSRSLFEEANRMVNEERQATHAACKKVEGLERQLDEVLDLCKSERDQLVELKLRMEKLSEEKDAVQRERDAIEFAFVQLQQQQHQQQQQFHHARRGMPITISGPPNAMTGASSGLNAELAAGSRKHVQQVFQYDGRQHRSSASSVISKTDSCYFSDGDHPGSHLINDPNEERIPSLGFHLWDPSFIEFKAYMESLLGASTKSSLVSDAAHKASQHSVSSSIASSGISSMYSFSIMSKSTPTGPLAANAVIPINTLLSNCRLLKKMYAEDVEATLRFDPGNLLSWAQRKRLMTAVTDNTLVVETVPQSSNTKDQDHSPVASAYPSGSLLAPSTVQSPAVARPNCALCGNCISTPLSYQYRLTDTANESRTICPYCRTRLTSVCTFYSVLRMISKRIISSTTTPEKLYLDFLRIRLNMFMARCGVGIITGAEVKAKRDSARSLISTSTLPHPPRTIEINVPNTTNAINTTTATAANVPNTTSTANATSTTNAVNAANVTPTTGGAKDARDLREARESKTIIQAPATIITMNLTPAQATLMHKGASRSALTRETPSLNHEEATSVSSRQHDSKISSPVEAPVSHSIP